MRPSGKRIATGMLMILAVIGFGVLVTAFYIGELPAADRAEAWRWFLAAWAVSAIGVALLLLPSWIKGTIVPDRAPTAAEVRSSVQLAAMIGGAIGVAGASLMGFVSLPGQIAVGALGCGMITAGMAYALALNFTKKGRAMLARAESNR